MGYLCEQALALSCEYVCRTGPFDHSGASFATDSPSERREKSGEEMDFKERMDAMPLLMGQGAGAVNEVMPAKQIMDEMVTGAVEILKRQASTITAVSDMKLTASL